MAESNGTRIALATCSGTPLRRRVSTSVDEILTSVDRGANTFIHIAAA